MGRHYGAILSHVPLDYGDTLEEIGQHLVQKRQEFVDLFQRWRLGPLEFDDSSALIDQLERRLVGFVHDCCALPNRTPNQLMPTVKLIARNPSDFLRNMNRYDPEATALVYSAFGDVSEENRKELEEFEWGRGPAPQLEEIAKAASEVLAYLRGLTRQRSRRGGQHLVLQGSLVWDLARIFIGYGGRVTQINRWVDTRSPEYFSEDAPFPAFLELVLPPVRPLAAKAGFRMQSTRSMTIRVLKDGVRTGPKPAALGQPFRPSI